MYAVIYFVTLSLCVLGKGVAVETNVVVSSENLVITEVGNRVVLPCPHVSDAVYSVDWMKGDNPVRAELVVMMDMFYLRGQRMGPGIDEEPHRFNVTDEFSLVISDVVEDDEGTYYCEVSEFESGMTRRTFTQLNVTGQGSSSSTIKVTSAGVVVAIVLVLKVF